MRDTAATEYGDHGELGQRGVRCNGCIAGGVPREVDGGACSGKRHCEWGTRREVGGSGDEGVRGQQARGGGDRGGGGGDRGGGEDGGRSAAGGSDA